MSQAPSSIVEKGADESSEKSIQPTSRKFGSCKWFNVSKGYGFILDDETKADLFVHQSNLNMQGFRSLEEGERVSYYIQDRANGKGMEAYAVSGEVEGEGLKGSSIHPLGKKKATSMRCFKCGKFAKHKASSCPNIRTNVKLCYICSSDEHVSLACPESKWNKSRKKDEVDEVARSDGTRSPILDGDLPKKFSKKVKVPAERLFE